MQDNPILATLLLLGRPLVAHYFAEVVQIGDDLARALTRVGKTIETTKNPSPEAKVTWLMGIWLGQDHISTSPFAVKPPELVCSHFFEPAMQTHLNGKPFVGKGIARTSKAGKLTASVYSIVNGDLTETEGDYKDGAWAVNIDGFDPPGGGYSLACDFDDVSSALSPCIQQCLAEEPLLAIALSFIHKFPNGKEFQQALSGCLRESQAEHTLNAMSGEQMELIVFAAIQQASFHVSDRQIQGLLSFCKKLIDFLVPTKVSGKITPAQLHNWGIISEEKMLAMNKEEEEKVAEKERKKVRETRSCRSRKKNGNYSEEKGPERTFTQEGTLSLARSKAQALLKKAVADASPAYVLEENEQANAAIAEQHQHQEQPDREASQDSDKKCSNDKHANEAQASDSGDSDEDSDDSEDEAPDSGDSDEDSDDSEDERIDHEGDKAGAGEKHATADTTPKPPEVDVLSKEEGDDAGEVAQVQNLPHLDDVWETDVNEIVLPRMVPASSAEKPDWMNGFNNQSLKVLRDLHVAGLMPAETNARCDIGAYTWPFMETTTPTPLWRFEVKARSGNYTLKKGIQDLVEKCSDHKDEESRHHAMLIGISRNKTEVDMWKIKKGGFYYFRVVVIVSGMGA